MTSIHVENEVEIERPLGEVFAFVSDQEHLPAWAAGVSRASRTSPGPVAVGTTYRIVGKMLGRRVESTYVVSEYEPDTLFAGRMVSSAFAVEETYRFEGDDRRTKLTVTADAQPSGFARLIGPLLAMGMARQVRTDHAKLKTILERRRTRPPKSKAAKPAVPAPVEAPAGPAGQAEPAQAEAGERASGE